VNRPLVALLAVISTVVAACSTTAVQGGDEPPTVVAAFYPLAEAAERIGGSHVRVVNLTPPGAEPHDYELTTKQAEIVLDADLVLLMGRGFQPAVERVARTRKRGVTVELLPRLRLTERADPHVWLDPVLMTAIAREIAGALDRVHPDEADDFASRRASYERRLTALNRRYEQGLESCRRRAIVTSHGAFGYMAHRYRLEQRAIAGVSPEAEPDPARLAALAELVRRERVTTIFTETLVSPRVGSTLAREAGAKTAVLDPIEGITDKDRRAGVDYVTIMDRNLATLRTALECS
jgi:zinc transport system substrate-binding protein